MVEVELKKDNTCNSLFDIFLKGVRLLLYIADTRNV